MNIFFPIFILINLAGFGQDTLVVNYCNPLIEKELYACKGSKDQLKCVDSLIQITLKNTDYSGKGNYPSAYFNRCRKLLMYHFNAGIISGLRGDLDQSFAYFNQMEIYLDTLNQNGKGNEFRDIKSAAHYQKAEYCTKTYYKDTAVFKRCNCKQFFPEYNDETIQLDSVSSPVKNQQPEIKYPYWGEFYSKDTLRMNKHFVSDSSSVIYFKTVLQALIQAKLVQNPAYYEMLGDPALKIKRDTLIYKLTAKYGQGKYERKCELAFTTSRYPEKFEFILFLMSNMEFPGHIKNLEIYIPIVVTTENSIHVSNFYVFDDHYLMEIRKMPRLKLH